MPYLNDKRRTLVREQGPTSAGDLNWLFTNEINEFLKERELNYQAINDIVGALDLVKSEFKRRVVAHYEDKKIEENGDVYDRRFTE